MERSKLEALIRKTRTIPFYGDFNNELYGVMKNAITELSNISKKSIQIVFESPGGNTEQSLWLGELMRMSECKIFGIVLNASSAACTILQFCDQRLIVPSGRIFIHNSQPTKAALDMIEYTTRKKWDRQSSIWGDLIEGQNAKIRQIFFEATGIKKKKWKKIMLKGTEYKNVYFDAKKALKMKLVDAIIPNDTLPNGYKLFIPPLDILK